MEEWGTPALVTIAVASFVSIVTVTVLIIGALCSALASTRAIMEYQSKRLVTLEGRISMLSDLCKKNKIEIPKMED